MTCLRQTSLIAHLLAALVTATLAAQGRPGPQDSTLIARILAAEDRRDTLDTSLTEGRRSTDPRIRLLATRAWDRIGDSTFTRRDSFPPLALPPVWPEAAWRLRYRALAGQRTDCVALGAALVDSAWPVRLHAADLLPATCAGNAAVLAVLASWLDRLPADLSRRERGGVSWQPAAHALLALSRLRPADAGQRLAGFVTSRNSHLRVYAARAAAVMADATTLYTLGRDRDPNVREAAIEALTRLTGHADDGLYLEALEAREPQVVRAAALALAGSPDTAVRIRLEHASTRWVARGNDSERDVRLALLKAAGRPASDDRPPGRHVELPPEAVALALGADVRVRVTMAEASGGGSFVVRFRGDVAPITAARVLALVDRGYYNGFTWHRVEHDFVIQGGSPLDNEYSGYRDYFRDELGTIAHPRGTVGMSTRGHDTGDAQWFVNLRDNPRLERDYTVFGEVVEGMDVVDQVMEGDVIQRIERVP